MASDVNKVGAYLSKGGSALATLAGPLAVVSGPAGAAVAIVGALAGIAGDVMQGAPETVHKANDPLPLLDAMRARVAARQAARNKH